MITVKFFKLNYPHSQYDRSGIPAEISVPTDSIDEAFVAACNAGGDPERKMLYKFN
jgi:hypothetical protein